MGEDRRTPTTGRSPFDDGTGWGWRPSRDPLLHPTSQCNLGLKGEITLSIWNVVLTATSHIHGNGQVTIYLVTVKIVRSASRSATMTGLWGHHRESSLLTELAGVPLAGVPWLVSLVGGPWWGGGMRGKPPGNSSFPTRKPRLTELT